MKPRIRKVPFSVFGIDSHWRCDGLGYTGYGGSPSFAYRHWTIQLRWDRAVRATNRPGWWEFWK